MRETRSEWQAISQSASQCFIDIEGEARGFTAGLDLGKMQDFSALVVIERIVGAREEWRRSALSVAPEKLHRKERLIRHDIVKLHRWPLGTPYTQIAVSVQGFMDKLPARPERAELVVDRTGGPVVESLADKGMRPIGVTITAGTLSHQRRPDDWTVPKGTLASLIDVVLHQRRLKVPDGSPLTEALRGELRAFTVRKTPAGNETFESGRESEHDDIVLATALAVWRGENRPTVRVQSLMRG